MLKLSWFRGGTAVRAKIWTIPLVIGSLSYIFAIATAGMFSFKISSVNSEVLLILIPLCDFWPIPSFDNYSNVNLQDRQAEFARYGSNINQLTKRAHVYVSECYNINSNSLSELCLPFERGWLPWSTNLDGTYPFKNDLCIMNAIQFDSGFIDSRTHLGINTRDDSIQYRRVTICTPTSTGGYVSNHVNGTSLGPV